jgi:hypothetical protein
MMGELNYFLGFQVKQLRDGTFISQMKYTQDLLKRFGMKDAKPAKTPMGTDGHVDLNKGGKSVDQKAYRSMIGSLKCPDPLGLKCDTITSPRRLVNTFLTSNSTEFK